MRISDWSSDVCSSDLDLIASVLENDGRLSRQIERMRSSNCRCSLIVEGGLMRKYHPKVPITKRAAMRSRLIYQYGIDVIETIDLRATAYRSEERLVGQECDSTCRYRW